jgi:hypothetical protein
MAKISTYPEVVPPSLDDFVVGTDVSDSLATKSFQISDILSLGIGVAPTLQQVTDAGETTTVPTVFSTTDPDLLDINSITATTDNGIGVFASSVTGTAVDAYSTSGIGVKSFSTDGISIKGFSNNNTGVDGGSTDGIGIYGESVNQVGIFAFSFNDTPFVADTIEGNDLNIAEFKRNGVNQCSISYDGTVNSKSFVIPGGTSSEYLMANGSTRTAPYRVYTAILTQIGTNAPVATVLENTLLGTVTFQYVSNGIYTATLIGAFTTGKTTATLDGGTFNQVFKAAQDNINTVRLVTYSTSGSVANDQMGLTTLEIRVYN